MPESDDEREAHYPEIAAVFATLVAHHETERAAQFVMRNERDTSNWKWVGRWERLRK